MRASPESSLANFDRNSNLDYKNVDIDGIQKWLVTLARPTRQVAMYVMLPPDYRPGIWSRLK